MIGTDHIHVCSDGETFAGVLEVVELDVEMVAWSMRDLVDWVGTAEG